MGYAPGYRTTTTFYDISGTSTAVYTTTTASVSGCSDGKLASRLDYTRCASDCSNTGSVLVQTPRPIPSAACDQQGYLIQVRTLYRVSLDDGSVTTAATINTDNNNPVNAIGYNTLDNFLYGTTTNPPRNLIRFNPSGQFQIFANVSQPYNVGEVDNNGQLWVRWNQYWAQYNLNPNQPNYVSLSSA